MTVYHAVLAFPPSPTGAPKDCDHLHVTKELAERCARRMTERYKQVYRAEVCP